MQQIRDYFERFSRLSDDDWDFFSNCLVKKKYPKKYLLLKEEEIENHVSFLEKGIVRFFIPKDDNDLTFAFGFQNEFISNYASFITREKSNCSAETLTESVLWQINYKDLQTVYMNTKTGEHIGRLIAEQLFLNKSNREMSLLNQSAEERYLQLLKHHTNLMQYIPLKYLASYIGVTPQALSRIRKRIS